MCELRMLPYNELLVRYVIFCLQISEVIQQTLYGMVNNKKEMDGLYHHPLALQYKEQTSVELNPNIKSASSEQSTYTPTTKSWNDLFT